MAIKKVWIEEGCIACGNCEQVAPKIFKVTDQSHVIDGAPINEYEKEIKEAAEECPAGVIKYEEG